MGFLDAFGSNDPQSEAMRQGLLRMGLALMQAKGNPGQILGQAGTEGVNGMQSFQDRQFKQKLQQEALAEIARKKVIQGREDTAYQDSQNLSLLPSQFAKDATQMGNQATLAQTGNLNPTTSNAAIQSANAQPGFDYQGLINKYQSTKGGMPMALALQAAIKKDMTPTIVPQGSAALAPGATQPFFTNPKDNSTEQIKNYEYAVAHGYKGSPVDFATQTSASKAQVWADARERSATRIADAKAKLATGAQLVPEDTQLMADQYLAGDKSVLVGLNRGAQSANNIVAVRKAIREGAMARGMSGSDIAAKLAEYSGNVAAQRTVGTRSANIEVAGNAMESQVPIALAASAEVARSGFLPFGKAQVMFNEQTNNVPMRKLAAANNAIVNLYSRAINPTGVGTVSDKEHARQILMTAYDQPSYEATVKQMLLEINAERQALPKARQTFTDAISGPKTTGSTSGWSITPVN